MKTAGALGVIGALSSSATALADDGEGGEGARFRWDIISIDFTTGTVSAGGSASARANLDTGIITLTGSGTFRPGQRKAVTGGGTWSTTGTAGVGHGTYRVTELVEWHLAPGTFPLTIDAIGDKADARAGLAVLRVRYSDQSEGILVVSCTIAGTPSSVFEGIRTSRGFVYYWNGDIAADNVNHTLFHFLSKAEKD
ncbi:MAG: hypothetical protein AABM40_07445 [Chloroflexota bacterium]